MSKPKEELEKEKLAEEEAERLEAEKEAAEEAAEKARKEEEKAKKKAEKEAAKKKKEEDEAAAEQTKKLVGSSEEVLVETSDQKDLGTYTNAAKKVMKHIYPHMVNGHKMHYLEVEGNTTHVLSEEEYKMMVNK